ncbi:DUF4381 domain-containing protein [Pandoraea commovens]|uniref:DUF4381 domain-containing protein n=1 Tax=Pandoraea commovens TaxID=2508289 RepID=A0ABY5QMK1_9BURK|nr:DUF4381 domain-containing protein [Pandoraea commovens]UVA81864.1 DUF4381 domain-containing protein [Pandoraea commovens]
MSTTWVLAQTATQVPNVADDMPNDAPDTMDASLALTGLDELSLPPPVSYAPQTWGWGVVALLLLLGMAWCGWRAWRRYRRDRYRRLALAELETLASMTRDPARRTIAVASLAALLKRTALAAYPGAGVGRLRGAAWIEFLNGHRGHFVVADGHYLAMASYAPRGVDDTPQGDIDALMQRARQWIRDHHVEV